MGLNINDVSQSPCEKYGCEFFDLCKNDMLACESFFRYVANGMAANPKTKWCRLMPVPFPEMVPSKYWYKKTYEE